jgi:type IV pilus assembly protein PilW
MPTLELMKFHRTAPARSRGMSLVELMVGIAVGLLVVAAATTLAATQLIENRRLLLDTQVQQDLRATADIITRELRRAGFTDPVMNTVWMPDSASTQPIRNPFRLCPSQPGPAIDTREVVAYSYFRGATSTLVERCDGPVQLPRFSYLFSDQTIWSRIDSGSPQALTDVNTLKVDAFSVTRDVGRETTPRPRWSGKMACQKLCPDGTQDCWPDVKLDSLVVTITGHSAIDPNISRTVISRVRLRRNAVEFNAVDAAAPSSAPPVACP